MIVWPDTHERKKMAETAFVDDDRCERRTMIYVTKEQHEWLRTEAYKRKVSIAFIIRRAIADLIRSEQEKRA